MDVDALYSPLMLDKGVPSIKATWVEQFVRSPISFWCDVHAPEEQKTQWTRSSNVFSKSAKSINQM